MTLFRCLCSLKLHLLSTFACFLMALSGLSQTVFWTETFSNGCGSGCTAASYTGPNGTWGETNTGSNSASANRWYISGAESDNGGGATTCSTSATDPSLHVGSTTLGDIGAAYDASQRTNKRAESPAIDCSTYSGISISYNYIEFGDATTDDATFWYYDGATWSQLANPAKSVCCGGACSGLNQGQWTNFTMALPVSANGNANVRIGWNWSQDNVSGTDPSFAVDDIQLSYTTVLPVELINFGGEVVGGNTQLYWQTATELNNDFFTVERSRNGVRFHEVTRVAGAGTSHATLNYSVLDPTPPHGINYYRLKQTDYNGEYSYSKTIALNTLPEQDFMIDYAAGQSNGVTVHLVTSNASTVVLEVYDLMGQRLAVANYRAVEGPNTFHVGARLSDGIYLLKIGNAYTSKAKKFKVKG